MFEKLKKQLALDDSDDPMFKKIWNNKIYRTSIGALAGGILGFFYWKYIGCTAGSCPITSNPYQTVLLFGFLGGILVKDKNEVKKKEAEEKN